MIRIKQVETSGLERDPRPVEELPLMPEMPDQASLIVRGFRSVEAAAYNMPMLRLVTRAGLVVGALTEAVEFMQEGTLDSSDARSIGLMAVAAAATIGASIQDKQDKSRKPRNAPPTA